MSIFKQMVIMLGLFLAIILASVMYLNFKTASEFVQDQLYNDAKNTAHSLGLSLSKLPDPNDVVMIETTINAIYDSGYYQQIRLVGVDGSDIYNRTVDVQVVDVPEWFINVVDIETAMGSSDIMAGWSQLGTLEVVSHTGNAYRQLYTTLIDLIKTFIAIGIAVMVSLYLLLKMSLRSVDKIKLQANAILDNEFIILDYKPFTTECKIITNAMNTAIIKIKDIFERENETLKKYHELLYVDKSSGLYNRQYLITKLTDYLESNTTLSSGAYVIVSLDGIHNLKKAIGYEKQQEFIAFVADELNRNFIDFQDNLIVRLNESDFFVILPTVDLDSINANAKEIAENISNYTKDFRDDVQECQTLGCAIGSYDSDDSIKSILARADLASTKAKQCDGFVADVQVDEKATLVLGREEWREELLSSMDEDRLLLAFQNVAIYKDNTLEPISKEVFLRLKDKNSLIHNAGYFIPMATSLGLIDRIDQYMIQKVLELIDASYTAQSITVNISGSFIAQASNIKWLETILERIDNGCKIWFEINNLSVINNPDNAIILRNIIKKHSCSFGIDQFSIPDSGAGYLQQIRPDYIKSNQAYLLDMLKNKETGMAQGGFINLFKSLGISIIAMNIEEEEQLNTLYELGIDRFQGALVSPVSL